MVLLILASVMVQLQDRTSPESASQECVELGVIEEARRRQRSRRRIVAMLTALLALGLGVLAAFLGGGSGSRARVEFARRHAQVPGARTSARIRSAARIAPSLTGGSTGWEVRSGGGGSCCSVPVRGEPLAGGITVDSRSGYDTATFLAGPELAAVQVAGHRIPITTVPGHLPFGLRLVQVKIEHPHAGQAPPAQTPQVPWPTRPMLALDSRGRALEPSKTPDEQLIPTRWWQRPQAPASGPCRLSAHGLRGLSAQWGHVAGAIAPYPRPIAGRAFSSCIDTEYYLHGWPLDAAILLDAGHPGSPPAPIPGLSAAPGARGFLNGPGGFQGDITAARLGDAWLAVAGGRGLAQRLEVLRHLTATIHLPGR
jgi:hypothetical protein